jgi:hypothetical protein
MKMATEQKFCSVFVERDFFSIRSFTSLQLQLSLDCRFDPCLFTRHRNNPSFTGLYLGEGHRPFDRRIVRV